MGHKIRAQVGKTNVSGDGNFVTQTGTINQNNSNNTTINNNYSSNNINSTSNNPFIIGFFFLFILAAICYGLFKYSEHIETAIKYSPILLTPSLFAFLKLCKNNNVDTRYLFNFFSILAFSFIPFYYSPELFNEYYFKELAKHASTSRNILEFWKIDTFWKSYAIYYLITIGTIIALLILNIFFSIFFMLYSLGKRRQSSLFSLFGGFLLLIAIIYLAENPGDIIDWLSKFFTSKIPYYK